MPTRFYLPSSGAAAISPTFGTGWEAQASAGVSRLAAVVDTPSGTAMATVTNADANNNDQDILFRQWVYGPLLAQTIAAQTVKIQMRANETDFGNNLVLAWLIRVVAPNGTTFRGTVVGSAGNPRRDTQEVAAPTLTNRGDSVTSSAVNVTAGDYLVIEVGLAGDPISAGHDGSIRIGDNGGSDLPENDTSTSDFNPWIEFADNIVGEVHEGAISFSGAGSFAAAGERGVRGASALSGAGSFAAAAEHGLRGIAALTGAGDLAPAGSTGLLAASSLTGAGSVVFTPPAVEGAVSLVGAGSFGGDAQLGHGAVVVLEGAGDFAAAGGVGLTGVIDLSGAGTLVLSATATVEGALSLHGEGTFGAAPYVLVVFDLPPSPRAVVYIHHGATLQRIGELTAVRDLNRSYALYEHTRTASMTVARSDPALEHTRVADAHVVAIQSVEYPLLWVGRIVERAGDRRARTVSLTADSYDAVLGERYLPAGFATPRGARRAVRQVVDLVNAANPTGIGLGYIEDANAPPLTLSRESGLAALDRIAETAGLEWWLSYSVVRGQLEILLNMAAERGADYSASVALVSPGNWDVQGWRESGRAIAYAQTVVGGQVSPIEEFAEREGATVARGVEASQGDDVTQALVVEARRVLAFGHLIRGESSFVAPTQRRERLAVIESLREAGVPMEVAQALLDRPLPQRVILGRAIPDVEGQPANSWRYLEPGNVVRVSAADVFDGDYEGVGRVLATQPMEHERYLDLVMEIA